MSAALCLRENIKYHFLFFRNAFAKICRDSSTPKYLSCSAKDQETGGKKHDELIPPKGVSYSVFRLFKDAKEPLGPGAEKCGDYKNPEYYGYHKYSFSQLLVEILKNRDAKPAKECRHTLQRAEVESATPAKPTNAEVTKSTKDESISKCGEEKFYVVKEVFGAESKGKAKESKVAEGEAVDCKKGAAEVKKSPVECEAKVGGEEAMKKEKEAVECKEKKPTECGNEKSKGKKLKKKGKKCKDKKK